MGQIEVWRSELRLWQGSVESGVHWHGFHHNLGSALFHKERFDEAAHHFQESLRLFETPLVHMAVGNMALKLRYADDEVLRSYDRVGDRQPWPLGPPPRRNLPQPWCPLRTRPERRETRLGGFKASV